MKSELRLIDQISMKFEESWNPEQGAQEIFAFITEEQPPNELANALCTELILIDLHRRWQHWGSNSLEGFEIDELILALAEKTASRYILEAQSHGIHLNEQQIQQISEEDFISRARYGNVPRPEVEFPKKKATRFQPHIAIVKEGKKLFEDVFWSPIVVGRQAVGEPLPFAWVDQENRVKLICEIGQEPLISRSQFSLQIVNRNYAVIQNISSNRHFSVKGKHVAPGQRLLLEMPIEIGLDILSVVASRNSKR